MKTTSLFLPGHSVLQVLFCTDMPSQKAPPLSGAGLVQVRERFCTPRPQRTLHGDQSVHDDHPPFTVCAREWRERDKYIVIVNYILWITVHFLLLQTALGCLRHKSFIRGEKKNSLFTQRINFVFPSIYSSSDLLPVILWDDELLSSSAVTRNTSTPPTIVHLSGAKGKSKPVRYFITIMEMNDWWASRTDCQKESDIFLQKINAPSEKIKITGWEVSGPISRTPQLTRWARR